MYYALVHSYLRYGIVVWGNAAENILKPLHAVLNRVVRIMTFAPFGIGTKPIFDFLQILDISQIFKLESGKFVYKTKNNMLPISTIANHFERRAVMHHHNLRDHANRFFITPFVLLSSFKQKSLHYRGQHLWNSIAELIRLSESFCIFKKCYKAHLLQELAD